MRFPAVASQNETEIARGSTRRRPSLASPYNRLARRFAQRIGASRFGLSGLLLIAAWWDGEGSPESGPEVPSVAPFPAWIDIRDAARFSALMLQKWLVKRGPLKRCATGAVAAGKTFWNLAVERVRNRNSASSSYEPGTETVRQ